MCRLLFSLTVLKKLDFVVMKLGIQGSDKAIDLNTLWCSVQMQWHQAFHHQIYRIHSPAPLCCLADVAPGRQEGKHREHALSVAFQHRDGSADHL